MAEWFHEYAPSITVRFFALIALLIVYGLVPYTIPLSFLHVVSLLLLAYGAWLFYRKRAFRAYFIILAALLNELLIPYFDGTFNLFLTIIIAAILILDIVSSPQL